MPADPAKRLTNREMIESLLAALAKAPNEHSTIGLDRNAKGVVQVHVELRTGDTPETRTARDVAVLTRELFDELCATYPLPATPDTNGGPE